MSPFKDKIILITGGTGTIGSKLVEQLLHYQPKQIRVFSRNETSQHLLMEKLGHTRIISMLIGDTRDKERLDLACQNVDYIFHAAALKHVPFCEYNPYEAVKTNIFGAQNVIDCAIKNKVKKVIAISTDKAANPLNVMGVSKLMMEKLFINANFSYGDIDTTFACVRFGNVAWSNGSVLPVWKRQAESLGTINLTQNGMTRFLMSIDQAVYLTLKAAEISQKSEVFILKMPAIRLIDLANIFIKKYYPQQKIKIKKTGSRSGEKMHEELLSNSDCTGEVWANQEMFIVVPEVKIYHWPQAKRYYKNFKKVTRTTSYFSKNHLNRSKISKII